MEKIPTDTPVVFVFFHGPTFADAIFFKAKLRLERSLNPTTVCERVFLKMYGYQTLIRAYNCTDGTVDSLVSNIVNDKSSVIVYPGGAREAFYSIDYQVLWNGRKGFAKVAKHAQVPIIPVFTTNTQQTCYQVFKKMNRSIYERTRFPWTICMGFFPIKMK
jgi:hypothetical protein